MRFVKLVLAGLVLAVAATPATWSEEAGSAATPEESAPVAEDVGDEPAAAPESDAGTMPQTAAEETKGQIASQTAVSEDADAPAALDTDATPDESSDTIETETAVAPPEPPALGAVGYDSEGRAGRVHVVVRGDTLWDVSDAYLGTPWVWPSIWTDNDEIENPHLIRPGDRIWITPSEMRRVTAAEADALLAGSPADTDEVAEAPPAAAEEVPEEARVFVVSSRGSTGFVSDEELEAAASVVESDPPRIMLSGGDHVYIGLGEGEVEKHDQFSIIRVDQAVHDPDSGKRLGYHVKNLGWLEVDEVHAETSGAWIRLSVREIEIGDRIIKRRELPTRVEIRESPRHVEGAVSFFADKRTVMATVDFVYLNRGTLDGLEVGSPLEVYVASFDTRDRARGEKVEVPNRVSAEMLVVHAEAETAVAFVTKTSTEIEVGDRFRGATP